MTTSVFQDDYHASVSASTHYSRFDKSD